MKPIYWVSAMLITLLLLASYYLFFNAKQLVELELPKRLLSETDTVILQVNDYVSDVMAEKPTSVPKVKSSGISFMLQFEGQSNVARNIEKRIYVKSNGSPVWFQQLFSNNSLYYSHVFYVDNLKRAVLNTNISANSIITLLWQQLTVLSLLFVVLLCLAAYLVRRKEIQHRMMVQRFRDAISAVNEGDFQFIKQVQGDVLLKEMICDFNYMLEQLKHQNQLADQEKKLLSAAALYDKLTGLGNKPMFNEAMKNKLVSAEPNGYLVLLRLASLDQINTTLGFEQGDAYVSRISHLLNKLCGVSKSEANMFRLNGKDFIAILPHDNTMMIDLWADELKQLLQDNQHDSYTCGCANFSIISFNNTSVLERLMASLDNGLSQAMTLAPNSYVMAKEDENSANGLTDWYDIVTRIIESKGITLNKQQLKHCAKNESLYNFELFTSFEVDGVSYNANDVFSSANRLGLSPGLDKLIIERTLQFSQEASISGARYLVNLSIESILDMDFYYWLKQWLASESALASSLSFQIPEQAIIHNFVATKQFITMLHVANSAVCLDYEGSQYSHLLNGSIDKLDIDMIKVSSHYTHHVNELKERASFVRSLVDIAHRVNVPVIASQVEKVEEWSQLEALGIDAAQGNLFGHVRPA